MKEKKCCVLLVYMWLCFFDTSGAEIALSFDQAVLKMVAFSPALKAADSEISEQAGLQKQTLLYPNPVGGYSVENVFGNKNWHGWNAAEARYEVAQLIELGGKRSFRYQSARFQFHAAQAGFAAKQLALLNRLLKRFMLVVAAQENVQLASEQTQTALDVYQAVAAKVELGKVSLIQQNKAQIALSTAQINLQKAKVDLSKSKDQLAILWGNTESDFEKASFPFYEVDLPPPFEMCLAHLRDNPELLQSQMEHLATHQNLNLEMSLAIPDVTITLGYKTLQDTGNRGLILGASIPLPLFNRNQGNIQKARAQTQKAYHLYVEQELALKNKLSMAYRDVVSAYQQTEKIRLTVLTAATQSFELAKMGYTEGKFEYLDMLDSQKTLFEAKEMYIQALLSYHHSRADIEYLNIQEGL